MKTLAVRNGLFNAYLADKTPMTSKRIELESLDKLMERGGFDYVEMG